MTHIVDDQGNERWIGKKTLVRDEDEQASSNADENLPEIQIIEESADLDAAENTSVNHTLDQYMLEIEQENIEDRVLTDMPRRYGINSFEERTFYPESNRSVTRFYNKPR